MIVRIWRVKITPGRMTDLETFANEVSLPIMRNQPGCLGAFFTRNGLNCATITIWENKDAADKLNSSATYVDRVRELVNSGILAGDQSIEILENYDGFILPGELNRALQRE